MSFAADLTRLCDEAGEKAEQVVRQVALDIGVALVNKSPVDTGRFRSNWTYNAGDFSRTTTTATDPSGAVSVAAIAAGLETWKPGQTIAIGNALPYASRLEHGYSKQAPAGMVATTRAEFEQFFANAVAGLK